jgi:uncharacterized membrane protein (UPF0127 family)
MWQQKRVMLVSSISLMVPLSGLVLFHLYFTDKDATLCYNDVCFHAHIVQTDEERKQWLMHKAHLSKYKWILFPFLEPQETDFWMKDVLLPLGIIRFDSWFTVLHTVSAMPCPTGPCPVYHYSGFASYVLEINEMRIDDLPIQEGQTWTSTFHNEDE